MTRRRALRALGALAMCGTLAVLLRDAPARWLVVDDGPGTSDAIVVLAGDPDYERTYTAVRLLHAGEGRLLVLTGGEPGPGDSALDLQKHAIARGADPTRIRVETVSHSTRESLLAVTPILDREGARTVTLVTSPYHQRRAWRAARRAWPDRVIRNRPADPSSFQPTGWWRHSRNRRVVVGEYAKLLYYLCSGWLA